MLCGVRIPHELGLAGHSDADAAFHAITDAILGTIGAGDIGSHFPPSEARWRDVDSAVFLRHAVGLLAERGGRIENVDLIIVCERPKIGPHRAAMTARLAAVLRDATVAFEAFDYARALERIEGFFWWFCDDYLELVKLRAYGDGGPAASAANALARALSTLQRLLAPFLPFATEEVWSWWMDGSIHRTEWPSSSDLRDAAGAWNPLVMGVASDVLREIRRAKSEAKVGMKAEIETVTVTDSHERIAALEMVVTDVRDTGKVAELIMEPGDEFSVVTVLAPVTEP